MPASTPLLSISAVRDALDGLRQARRLGDSPLRRLVWIQQKVGQSSRVSVTGFEIALNTILTEIVRDELVRLRQLESLEWPPPNADKNTLLDHFRADYSQNNVELEAWSILYHRYVAIDLDLQMDEAAELVSTTARNLRRRLNHGLFRLSEIVSRREAEARLDNRQMWLKLRLPAPSYVRLFAVEDTLNSLINTFCEASSPTPTLIVGPGGIGKTTLAYAAAERLIEASNIDELVWLTFETPTGFRAILSDIAHNLDLSYLVEATPHRLEAGLRNHFYQHTALVVLDNASHINDPAQTLPRLLKLIEPGWILLTSRHRLDVTLPLNTLDVQPLPRADFYDYLRFHARRQRVIRSRIPDEETLDLLYRSLGGNPLAGRLVISQLVTLPLDRVLDNLAELSTEREIPLFDWLFAAIWDTLSNEAKHTAVALIWLPVKGVYWHQILEAVALSAEQMDRALTELVNASLVDAAGSGPLYTMHALARHYVEAQAERPRWQSVYHYMLEQASARHQQLDQAADQPSNGKHALMLLRGELPPPRDFANLVTFVQQSAPTIHKTGQWESWRDLLCRLVDRLEQSGMGEFKPQVLLELGIAYRWLGQTQEAEDTLQATVEQSGLRGEFVIQADALLELSHLYRMQGSTAMAYEYSQRAAAAAKRFENRSLRRRAVVQLIKLTLQMGKYKEARILCEQALATYTPDEEVHGNVLSACAMTLLDSQQPAEALIMLRRALDMYTVDNNLPEQARTYLRLGMANYDLGHIDDALSFLEKGKAMMTAIGDALGEARILTNLGAVYLQQERWQQALSVWRDALELQSRLDDRVGMAYTWYNLADLQHQRGNKVEAGRALAEARNLANQLKMETLLSLIDGHAVANHSDVS